MRTSCKANELLKDLEIQNSVSYVMIQPKQVVLTVTANDIPGGIGAYLESYLHVVLHWGDGYSIDKVVCMCFHRSSKTSSMLSRSDRNVFPTE